MININRKNVAEVGDCSNCPTEHETVLQITVQPAEEVTVDFNLCDGCLSWLRGTLEPMPLDVGDPE